MTMTFLKRRNIKGQQIFENNFSISLAIMKMQNKTTVKYYLATVKMPVIKKVCRICNRYTLSAGIEMNATTVKNSMGITLKM